MGYSPKKTATPGGIWAAKNRVAVMEGRLPKRPRHNADVGGFCRWAQANLIVPGGGLRGGEPLKIYAWQRSFLADALREGVHEAGLATPRKNGKSSLIAALVLGYLVGPLGRGKPNWSAGAVSVDEALSKELRQNVLRLAEASELEGITGKGDFLYGMDGSSVEFLSSGKGSGHGRQWDMALIDEIGLMVSSKERDLIEAMRSALSTRRGGKLLMVSIRGESPYFEDVRNRRGDPGVVWHEYSASLSDDFKDPKVWRMANPGIPEIKSEAYMMASARRAEQGAHWEGSFRSLDLGSKISPDREMIVSLEVWKRCSSGSMPERAGPVAIGLDAGGPRSMTAAAVYWPEPGLLEAFGCYGGTPGLLERGAADGVGDRYSLMEREGSLQVHRGRLADIPQFLQCLESIIGDAEVIGCGFDRYRAAEIVDYFEQAGIHWKLEARGTGAHAVAHGSADVRAFQTACLSGHLRSRPCLLLESAIASSALRYDGAGNPALEKLTARSRNDALSAAVIGVGLGERWRARPSRGPVYHGLVAA